MTSQELHNKWFRMLGDYDRALLDTMREKMGLQEGFSFEELDKLAERIQNA